MSAGVLMPALLPVAGLLALGLTIDVFGLEGLVAIHVGPGVLSLAGGLAWWIADARQHAHPEQEERLS